MSGTNGEQSTRQPESKRAITRDQYDAVLLDTGTLCVLGYYREIPAVKVWNGPLLG